MHLFIFQGSSSVSSLTKNSQRAQVGWVFKITHWL